MENPNGNNVAVNQVVVVAVVLDDQVVEIQDIAQANQPNLGGWRRARLQRMPSGSWRRIGRLDRINYKD